MIEFHSEERARARCEALRWPNGPVCPHCGCARKPLRLRGISYRPGLYKCRDCYEQFTVTVGTVFDRSKVALTDWLFAIHLLCLREGKMRVTDLQRELGSQMGGVTYKTAWAMARQIRQAIQECQWSAMA